MYINYKIKGGIEYAMVVTSVRKGASVTKEKPLYLGRVIDKERSIFKNRERGIFVYDISTNTFRSVLAEYQEPAIQHKAKYPVRPTLVVSFGDVFLLDAGVSFITRMKGNFKIYKQLVKEHLGSLEKRENFVRRRDL